MNQSACDEASMKMCIVGFLKKDFSWVTHERATEIPTTRTVVFILRDSSYAWDGNIVWDARMYQENKNRKVTANTTSKNVRQLWFVFSGTRSTLGTMI